MINLLRFNFPEGGAHFLCSVSINQKFVYFLLDTGASKTVLDKNQVAELQTEHQLIEVDEFAIGISDTQIENFSVKISLFRLGNYSLKDYPFAVVDLGIVNQVYQNNDIPQVAGILGTDILIMFNALIDLPSNKLFINKKVT